MTEPFPLQWPPGWPRTPSHRRIGGQFRCTLAEARDALLAEFDRMKARHVVVSTDVPLRRDGLFHGSSGEPNDPGAAVYFQWRGKPYVIACDTYDRLWKNVRALAKTIEAMRAIERHGATSLLERAVSGFSALPPGASSAEPPPDPWWTVLNIAIDGVSPIEIAGDPHHPMRELTLKMAEALYKNKIAAAHPDRGGSHEKMVRLNRAIEDARRALGNEP